MPKLNINQRYKDLIPLLSEDEFRSLEESILAQGCRDTIKIWNDTIVDGHNRYAICTKHDIPFRTSQVRIKSQSGAIVWIIDNQLGRRNLTSAARISLAMQKVEMLRKQDPGAKIHARKATAKLAGVSENTVYKYMKIRKIGEPGLVSQVESGEKKIGEAYGQLELTTRIVEELYNRDDMPGLENAYAALAVAGNIGGIGNLYRFIFDRAGLVGDKEERGVILKRLEKQLRGVEGLTDILTHSN